LNIESADWIESVTVLACKHEAHLDLAEDCCRQLKISG